MLLVGREVRIGKNCTRGLEYGPRPQAVLKTEGTVFPNTDRPRPANNVFIIFFRRVLCVEFYVTNFTLSSFAFLCFLGHYLHFTFFAVKKNCWKRRESWKVSSGPYAGSG